MQPLFILNAANYITEVINDNLKDTGIFFRYFFQIIIILSLVNT
jgi:hypothetical protein